MEDKQFEDLTKALASGQSRRQAIKVIAGGVLSGVAGIFGARRAVEATDEYPTTTTKKPTTTTKKPTTTTKKPEFCGHSTGPYGGCMGACTSAGFTGNQCNDICGDGQHFGACPVGQGGGNPCCNAGYCNPANFESSNGGVTYVGPTSGCS